MGKSMTAMPKVPIDVSVICDECASELDVRFTKSDEGTIEATVKPCGVCIKNAAEDAAEEERSKHD